MELCAQCGKRGGDVSPLRRCSRCKIVRYCSRDCQSRDWPHHKVTCGESSVDGPQRPDQGNSTSQQDRTTSASAQANPNPFATLFDGTFYRTPWQQARSRAQEAFPGHQVTDDLTGDLDLTEQEMEVYPVPFEMPFMPFGVPFPFMPMPPVATKVRAVSRKVLVLQLVSCLLISPHVIWLVEDCNGKQTVVWFDTDTPAPYFRFHDLQVDHFLCIKQATITVLVQHLAGYIVVRDGSFVRVFKP